MKERQIIFSGPMVRAILAGQKTQTRRVVTDEHFKKLGLERDGDFIYTTEGPQWNGEFEGDFWCPYGGVGDRLWVRETWRPFDDDELFTCVKYRADDAVVKPKRWTNDQGFWCEQASQSPVSKWYPSIHMPRWASRITLEITGVRVERLQDISEVDAKAEGAVKEPPHAFGFMSLWRKINGPDSWAANPWVWVIEFKKV